MPSGDDGAFCKGSKECAAASVVKVGGAPHSIYTSLDNKCALSPNIVQDVSVTCDLTGQGRVRQYWHAPPLPNPDTTPACRRRRSHLLGSASLPWCAGRGSARPAPLRTP